MQDGAVPPVGQVYEVWKGVRQKIYLVLFMQKEVERVTPDSAELIELEDEESMHYKHTSERRHPRAARIDSHTLVSWDDGPRL